MNSRVVACSCAGLRLSASHVFTMLTIVCIMATTVAGAQLAIGGDKTVSDSNDSKGLSRLSDSEAEFLDAHGWGSRIKNDKPVVWISVDEQRMRIIEGREIVWGAPCSTSEKGTGSIANSNKTPLGWHKILRKIGDGVKLGQVFRGRMPTDEVWKPGENIKEDLVLTRILVLDGLEPGKNKGGNVDSRTRCIYVHGTNDEDRVGTPASHGCVRLKNDDVVKAFDLVPVGALLLITEKTANKAD